MESVEEALTGHLELAEQLRLQLLTLQTSLERPPPGAAQSTVRPSVLAGALRSLPSALSVLMWGELLVPSRPAPAATVCMPARPPAEWFVLISRVAFRSSDSLGCVGAGT
eukprot:COSAG02_NODE_709_length_18217_cov_13.019704_18_plen_110_part_00